SQARAARGPAAGCAPGRAADADTTPAGGRRHRRQGGLERGLPAEPGRPDLQAPGRALPVRPLAELAETEVPPAPGIRHRRLYRTDRRAPPPGRIAGGPARRPPIALCG